MSNKCVCVGGGGVGGGGEGPTADYMIKFSLISSAWKMAIMPYRQRRSKADSLLLQNHRIEYTCRLIRKFAVCIVHITLIWIAISENIPMNMCAQLRFTILRIYTVWPKYLLCAFWIAKDATRLHTDNEDWSDCARSLIWIFFWRICQNVRFLMLQLINRWVWREIFYKATGKLIKPVIVQP